MTNRITKKTLANLAMARFSGTNRDVICPYTTREMRYYLARGLSHLKPAVLRQLIYQTSLPVNLFRQLVDDLLHEHCSEFAEHSLKWAYPDAYPVPHPDLLTRMIHYSEAWEGFSSDEPWDNSAHKRIIYFFDTEHATRLAEMEARF